MSLLQNRLGIAVLVFLLVGFFVPCNATAVEVNSIRSKHIVDGQVRERDIAGKAVTTSKIRNNAVVGSKIANHTITKNKLAFDPTGPQGDQGPPGVANPLLHLSTYFGQRAFINNFPLESFNAVRCDRADGGAITVTFNGSQYTGIGFIGWEGISTVGAYYAAFYVSSPLGVKGLGTSASIRVSSNKLTRNFIGVVTRAGLAAVEEDNYVYAIEVRPLLGMLEKSRKYSIWQKMTIPDVVKQVFRDHGLTDTDFEEELNDTYREWEFVAQYNETDLNLISRLTEQEGFYYYFSSTGAVILSDLATHPSAGTATYYGHLAEPVGGAQLITLNAANTMPGNIFSVDGYDFKVPGKELLISAAAGGIGNEYEFSASLREVEDSDHLANINMHRSIAAADSYQGSSNNPAFRAGYLANFVDNAGGGFGGDYLLTRINHVALLDTDNQCVTYANSFEATNSPANYRPPRSTPKPVAHGVTTAIVTGPAGEEIYTDEHGRVKVQFHWDREGKADENSSCWIRVSQAWAGAKWGAMYIPRIGQEVIVNFIDGDPCLPIITGSVYHGNNKPPYELPAEKTKSTIKSDSSLGGGNSNEFRFEDKAGSEEVLIRGAKDMYIQAEDQMQLNAENGVSMQSEEGAVLVDGEPIILRSGDNFISIRSDKEYIELRSGDNFISIGPNGIISSTEIMTP